jgi:phospholipase C
VQPANQPSAGGSNTLPLINDTNPAAPNYETNIGDELSGANVPWAWYAGGWNDAVAGHPGPLFQYHHQPLNYFANYAPGMPGRTHLKDETEFVAAAQAGTLPAVSFVKPYGTENEHPGYASTANGEQHLVDLLKAIRSGPDARDTLVVVTYDEFGGQWDHVVPPGAGAGATAGPSDEYGPGTRIPALIIGGKFTTSGVDSTSYDTTSILATIEHLHGLAPLDTRFGRDAKVADLRKAVQAGHGH